MKKGERPRERKKERIKGKQQELYCVLVRNVQQLESECNSKD